MWYTFKFYNLLKKDKFLYKQILKKELFKTNISLALSFLKKLT